MAWNRKFPNIGDKFNRLTVIAEAAFVGIETVVECVCECGSKRTYFLGNLRRGHTKSCGCLKIETAGRQRITHGFTKKSEYAIWMSAIQRCKNPNDSNWPRYGGRGISICDRWLKFENFIADMGVRPSKSHSIERVDNNLGYRPDNCRWATRAEQARNTRANRYLEHEGRSMCLADWAAELGISSPQLHVALKLRGSLSQVIFHRNNPLKPRRPWEEAGIPKTTWYRKHGPLGPRK
jgi:hypothetical protein